MKKQVHPNYITASNLIFGSFGLGLLSLFFSDNILSSLQNANLSIGTIIFFIVIVVIGLFFIAGIGLTVRRGINSVKYFLIVIVILQVIGIPLRINALMQKPDHGILFMAQIIMLVWAVVLILIISKPLVNNPDNQQS